MTVSKGLPISCAFPDFFHNSPDSFRILLIPGSKIQTKAYIEIGQYIVLFAHDGTELFLVHGLRMADGRAAVIDAAFLPFPIIKAALSPFIQKGFQFFHPAGFFAAEDAGNAGKVHYPITFGRKASTLS